jgi:hypothetical protein
LLEFGRARPQILPWSQVSTVDWDFERMNSVRDTEDGIAKETCYDHPNIPSSVTGFYELKD